MKLTKDVQIAVALLAALSHNSILKLSAVATMKSVSLHFLEQVARKLRIAGYIRSCRGPGGGYLLTNKEKPNLSELMSALGRQPTEDVLPNSVHLQKSVNALLATLTL